MIPRNVLSFPSISGIVRFILPFTRPVLEVPCAKITSFLTLVLLICFETVLLSTVSDCTKSFTVHWNTSNPIFRIDNTDHIIDVNKGNGMFEYDQVNIICPVYNPGTHEEDAEKYIIYNVSKEEYDTCRITNQNPRIIAVCDRPSRQMYFTITFRSFTPQPNGLEFHPGQDYYFISTSSKDDLHRRIGGRCLTNNMKVIFKVCCRPDEFHNQSTLSDSSSASPIKTSMAPTPVVPTRFRPSSRPTTHTLLVYPVPPAVKPTALDFPKPTTKKSHEYDKHPNEVVKNEELTLSSGSSLSSSIYCISLIIVFQVVR